RPYDRNSARSTAGFEGAITLHSFSKPHLDAAGLKAGDAVTVTLELEQGPRPVDVPLALSAALHESGLTETFGQLTYSKRKEFARQVAEAKTHETRERRGPKGLEANRWEGGTGG